MLVVLDYDLEVERPLNHKEADFERTIWTNNLNRFGESYVLMSSITEMNPNRSLQLSTCTSVTFLADFMFLTYLAVQFFDCLKF